MPPSTATRAPPASRAPQRGRFTFGGGAGYINASSPTFTDCRFENNLGGSFGGAFDQATQSALLTSQLF